MKELLNYTIFDAFKRGDSKTFYANLGFVQNYYFSTNSYYPFMCILTRLYCESNNSRETGDVQLEILKSLIREKDVNGNYIYKINDSIKSEVSTNLNDYKALDFALINNKAELAIELLKREDIKVKKPIVGKRETYIYPIHEAFNYCKAAAVFMIEREMVSLDDIAYVDEEQTLHVKDDLKKAGSLYDDYDFEDSSSTKKQIDSKNRNL